MRWHLWERAASLNFLILGFCIGLCSGFAIPVAQTFGAKEYSADAPVCRKCNGAILAAGISHCVLQSMTALFLQTDPGSDPHAGEYSGRRVPVS